MNYANAPTESREMGRLVRRIVASAGAERGGAAAEFLLAIGTRRLRLRDADLDLVLTADPGEVPLVEFMLTACRAVAGRSAEASAA